MKRLMILATLALPGCVTAQDPCAGSAARRAVYQSAITLADAAIASGHGETAVLVGRQAAVTALMVLDARCPRASL